MIDLVIFDFDGVVVDSEIVSNRVLAEVATELGQPMTASEAVSFFGGTTLSQQVTKLEALAGRPLGDEFGIGLHRRTLNALATVRPIHGIERFLAWLDTTPICIGSTSASDRIEHCLKAIGLTERFNGHVFSVSMVQRNKPSPDIFLHAARCMGARPEHTLVIEDSVHGVQAGVAAGMKVIGLTAASHVSVTHAEHLRQAGANQIAGDYEDVRAFLSPLVLPGIFRLR